MPPYGTCHDLRGQVTGVTRSEHRVAVYINVNGGWWTKPYFVPALTTIWPCGSFICDITTGGIDHNATRIRACVVPVGYTPPIMSGQSTIPDELKQNAVDCTDITRFP